MMANRKSLSKKNRFDVFKRDRFRCSYCGMTPPKVVLEVDHIIPVCEGGSDDINNLTTACFDCNRGKSGDSLDSIPINIEERMRIEDEKREQVKKFEAMLRRVKKAREKEVDRLAVYWCDLDLPENKKGTLTLSDEWKRSIRMFVERMNSVSIEEAMEKAHSKSGIYDPRSRLKYFCGICWRMIKESGNG